MANYIDSIGMYITVDSDATTSATQVTIGGVNGLELPEATTPEFMVTLLSATTVSKKPGKVDPGTLGIDCQVNWDDAGQDHLYDMQNSSEVRGFTINITDSQATLNTLTFEGFVTTVPSGSTGGAEGDALRGTYVVTLASGATRA